nr:MAG TPA: hypothetical protein [Bacteriophage sp.]
MPIQGFLFVKVDNYNYILLLCMVDTARLISCI